MFGANFGERWAVFDWYIPGAEQKDAYVFVRAVLAQAIYADAMMVEPARAYAQAPAWHYRFAYGAEALRARMLERCTLAMCLTYWARWTRLWLRRQMLPILKRRRSFKSIGLGSRASEIPMAPGGRIGQASASRYARDRAVKENRMHRVRA